MKTKAQLDEEERKANAARAAEDDPDEDKKDPEAENEEPPKEAGLEPSGVCSVCGMSNDEDAKFCDQCGASMAAPPLGGDEPAPSSTRPGAAAVVAPKRVSMEGSVASILGASSESVPAVKTRAIDLRQVFDTAVGVTGQSAPSGIVGALLTFPERLRAGDRAASDLKRQKVTKAQNDRTDLARRLNALGLDAWPRSMIYEDRVSDDKETGATTRTIALRPVIAQMDLGVLRGMVESYEGATRRKPRDPFRPSEERAKAAAFAADPRKPPRADADAATVIAWAKGQPAFASVRKQTPSTITDEAIARQMAATMQPRGGVQ